MHTHDNDDLLYTLWNAPADKTDEGETERALATFRKHRRSYSRARRNRRLPLSVLKYAAVIAAPLLTALAAWNYSAQYYADENELVELYVPAGKTDSLLLSDNTKVTLNSGTSIIYPARFNSHNLNRNVYVNGNCHFAVARDVMHPFVVNMGALKVKVLGTHFSVDSYNDDEKITVTLEEGLVKVFDKKRAVTLRPNEQLVYWRKDGSMSKRRVDALASNSWVGGTVGFAAQPLSEILKTLGRRYNVRFRLEGGIDTGRRYTMNFRKDEPIDNVMRVLTMASGNIGYKRNGNDITLYPR